MSQELGSLILLSSKNVFSLLVRFDVQRSLHTCNLMVHSYKSEVYPRLLQTIKMESFATIANGNKFTTIHCGKYRNFT